MKKLLLRTIPLGLVIALSMATRSVAYTPDPIQCQSLLPRGDPASFTAPGSCHTDIFYSTGAYHHGGSITHTYSSFVVDAASAGKRMVKAASTVTMSYVPGMRSPSAQECSDINGGGYLPAPKQVYQYYCPDPRSHVIDVTGTFRDPNTACAAQVGTYDNYLASHGCDQKYAVHSGGSLDDPIKQCMSGGGQFAFGPNSSSIYCCPSSYDRSGYSNQYNACVTNQIAINNALPPETDCYCDSPTNYFKFDASTPNLWACTPCAPGLVADKLGTGCRSNCPTGQAPDAMGVCSACDLTVNEIVTTTGQCLPKCVAPNVRVGATCTQVCPSGMVPNITGTDPVTGAPVTTCGCNDTRFNAGTRFPAYPQTRGGVSGFFYSSAVNAATVNAACVCGSAQGSVTLWDQASAINLPQPTLAYGQVALLKPQIPNTPDQYVCGCPNYNETFGQDPATGAWRCRPLLKGAPGTTYLVSLDATKTLADNGMIAASTEQPTLPKAFLRGSTNDVSESYSRRIWRCAPGMFLDTTTNTCSEVTIAALAKMQCDDTAGQIVPSSTTDTTITAFFGSAAGAGKTFVNITNKRLACCLANNQNPVIGTKFHCAESPLPATYPVATRFDDYFDYAGGNITLDAGVPFPNRFYLLGGDKTPVVGIFREDGTRCAFTAAMTPSAEMAFLSTVAKNAKDPAKKDAPLAGIAGAPVDPKCRYVIRAALQVNCPPVGGIDPTTGLALNNTITVGGARRCGTAANLMVHYDVLDFSNPNATHQIILKEANTVAGGLNSMIDVKKLLGL